MPLGSVSMVGSNSTNRREELVFNSFEEMHEHVEKLCRTYRYTSFQTAFSDLTGFHKKRRDEKASALFDLVTQIKRDGAHGHLNDDFFKNVEKKYPKMNKGRDSDVAKTFDAVKKFYATATLNANEAMPMQELRHGK